METVNSITITTEEKNIIRELAKKTAELASDPVNAERRERAGGINSLRPARPIVWIDEIPWHEMDIGGELKNRCVSREAVIMETHFRRILFRWKYFQADMVVTNAYHVSKAYDSTNDTSTNDAGNKTADESAWLAPGYGTLFGISSVPIKEETIKTHAESGIMSHHYEDQLDTGEKVDALKAPQITARPDIDARNAAFAADILDGIMPVKLRGHQIYYSPWDEIAMLRGVTACYMDMASESGFTHRIAQKMNAVYRDAYGQMEAQDLLDVDLESLHCTPPWADELPAKDFGGKIRFRDVWFRGMAQLFASVSPEMQNEFDLQYMRPMMEKCGLSYYGCCEPLDKFIPYLKKVPNMRKIGVSPWADVRSSAEQIGGDYVAACKPNPANAARFSEEAVEKEIAETAEACIENKCPYELVLKDISTVGGDPRNLIRWADTVRRTLDRYY